MANDLKQGSKGCSDQSGTTVSYTYSCHNKTITVTNIEGGGPLYKFFNIGGNEIGKIVYTGGDFPEQTFTDVVDENGDLYLLVD